MQVDAFGSPDSLLLTKVFAFNPDSNCMLQAGASLLGKPPKGVAGLCLQCPYHPRDLLACACVCKAWRNGKAKAVLPVLMLHEDDLEWLIQLNHVQMAAVRDVHMPILPVGSGCATASVMLLAYICGLLPMLQRLKLEWGDFNYMQEEVIEVGLHS